MVARNGRGYEIVAEYESRTFRTAQNYIRATTLQVCTTTAMFYSLCYMLLFSYLQIIFTIFEK